MSTEHSHEHFSEGASCCAGGCYSGSCCGSGDAIRPVPAVLGISLFIAALVLGAAPGAAGPPTREPTC